MGREANGERLTEVVGLKWGFKARCDDISDALDALPEKLEDQFNAATEKLEKLIEQYKAWLTEQEMMEGQVIDRSILGHHSIDFHPRTSVDRNTKVIPRMMPPRVAEKYLCPLNYIVKTDSVYVLKRT